MLSEQEPFIRNPLSSILEETGAIVLKYHSVIIHTRRNRVENRIKLLSKVIII